jgi:hypothetical protein
MERKIRIEIRKEEQRAETRKTEHEREYTEIKRIKVSVNK